MDVKARANDAILSWLYGVERPVILGWDISGEVVEIGSEVVDFEVGDEVFGMINFFGDGKGYAEYIAAPSTQLAIKPKSRLNGILENPDHSKNSIGCDLTSLFIRKNTEKVKNCTAKGNVFRLFLTKKKCMYRIILATILLSVNSWLSHAQTAIKPGKHEMSFSVLTRNGPVKVGVISDDIHINNNMVAVYSVMHMENSNEVRVDTTIADATTFLPSYRSSFNKHYELSLQYGKEITGYYLDKQTGKKTQIKDHATGNFVDGNFYQYFLTTLPLATGYTESMELYDYKPNDQSNIKKVWIKEVKSNLYASSSSGERKVWQVTAATEGTHDSYVYFIDKDTRKIWKIEFQVSGKNFLLEDSPYHTQFSNQATLKLITDGKSVIQGQVFTRGNMKNLELKKRFAQKGTAVQLIPYTDFFKEWFEIDEKGHKTGRWAGWKPLSEDAKKCIKSTEVYDKEGHFEFTNLMPGDYLLLANFFTANHLSHEEDSYSNVYINGNYVGTEKTGVSFKDDGIGFASKNVRKIVTIKQDGEKLTIKLN